MKIKVNSSTIVKPSMEKPRTTMWISNLDAIIPTGYHVLTLYFYRSTGAADFFDAAAMKAALSRALVDFYPIAGRLKKGDNGRVEIDCNGEGVLFVEAEADSEIDDLGDFTPKPELDLIPKVDYSQGISTYPITMLQVTRFKCGGVCLGIGNEHIVVDGMSGIHFLNTWSNLARGLDVAIPPFFDHRLLSARSPPEPKFSHVEYQPPPQLKNPQDNNSSNSETTFSIFKLTRDQLNALKAICKEDEENKATYSSFVVVAGHLWRCVCRAHGLPEDQETRLYIMVDGRSRLQPPLPAGYFGNVVFKATTIASCGDLESNPLKFTVPKIQESLVRMNDEYLRSAIDYLEGGLEPDARDPSLFKCPNLSIISWVTLPFYDADFGWGKPVYVGIGVIPSEGHVIVQPSPINDGSLFFALSLPKEKMQVFEKLFYDI